MSTLKVDKVLAADGTETTEVEVPSLDKRMAAAWVRYLNTTDISDSYNVSSVVDIGTGQCEVNFENDLANKNYCITSMGQRVGGDTSDFACVSIKRGATWSVSKTPGIRTFSTTSTAVDLHRVCLIIMGEK